MEKSSIKKLKDWKKQMRMIRQMDIKEECEKLVNNIQKGTDTLIIQLQKLSTITQKQFIEEIRNANNAFKEINVPMQKQKKIKKHKDQKKQNIQKLTQENPLEIKDNSDLKKQDDLIQDQTSIEQKQDTKEQQISQFIKITKDKTEKQDMICEVCTIENLVQESPSAQKDEEKISTESEMDQEKIQPILNTEQDKIIEEVKNIEKTEEVKNVDKKEIEEVKTLNQDPLQKLIINSIKLSIQQPVKPQFKIIKLVSSSLSSVK